MLITPAEDAAQFLAPLPVSVISGVGPTAVAGLERIGVRTISQLREVPAATVARVLGPRTPEVLRLADGSDRTGLGHRTQDRKSTRLNSSHVAISYAVFCLKKKKAKTVPRHGQP